MMSIVAELAPRPLEALSTAEMNAGSCAGPSKAAPAHHTGGSSSSGKSSQCSSSGKRKAHDGDGTLSDIGCETTDGQCAARCVESSKKIRVDKQPSTSPHKRREGSAPSEESMSPEKIAAALEKEEKRKQREAKKAEKAKKEAEKEAKLQKEAQMRKRAANFMSSFVQQRAHKLASPQKEGQLIAMQSDYQRCFPPCTYKDAAPINRHRRALDEAEFDRALQHPPEGTPDLLYGFLRKGRQKPTAPTKRRSRKGIRAPISVRDSMRLVTEAGVLGDDRLEENGRRGLNNLADRKRVPMKLLHFESDRRPAWYGTWTRSSNLVGPRRPLGQDPVALDYTYDSDAEWEDVDPLDGDDVQDNDDREEEDHFSRSDSDSEMGDWLIDDLEEEEDEEMDEGHPVLQIDSTGPFDSPSGPLHLVKGVNADVSELKAKRKKKKIIGRRFETKLIKFETGPHWEEILGVPTYDGFRGYQMEMLNDARPGLDPFTFTSAIAEQLQPGVNGSESANDKTAEKPETSRPNTTPASKDPSLASSPANAALLARAKSFPDEHISQLLQAIEGKVTIRPILVEELRATVVSWGKVGITKTTLEACLTVYAEKLNKKAGGKWVIRDEYRPMAGLN